MSLSALTCAKTVSGKAFNESMKMIFKSLCLSGGIRQAIHLERKMHHAYQKNP